MPPWAGLGSLPQPGDGPPESPLSPVDPPSLPEPVPVDRILIGVQLLYDNMTPADAEAAYKMQKALVQPLKVHLSL